MKHLILCGGIGSRLWPLSRSNMPKQFYPLINGKSLFQDTVIRNEEYCESVIIATNKEQFLLAKYQLLNCGITKYSGIIEPCGRNTAPAIALACMGLKQNELVLVTPSDQLIKNLDNYRKVVNRGVELAELGNIVTFGIKPTSAESGFGYIEAFNEDVISFKEKPILKIAEEYFKSGKYYWNSGIFCFKAGVFLDELKKYSPEVYNSCKVVFKQCSGDFIEPSYESMINIPSISIDYAVIEKSNIVKVVPAGIGWSDLGSFDAIYNEMYNPTIDNAIITSIDPVVINSSKNLIISDKKVVLVDASDLIIIDTEDTLLISKRGSSHKALNNQ